MHPVRFKSEESGDKSGLQGGVQEWFICQVSKTLGVNFTHASSNLASTAPSIKMKNNKNNQQIVIGGAVVFRENRRRRQFLLVKQKEGDDWEIPKVTVRRGESSVRAVLRMTSEQAGMTARVLEEAGRATSTTMVNSKTIPEKFYYYLLLQKGGNTELMGFNQYRWFEYGEASKKLSIKREKDMLKGGRDALKEWEKTHSVKKQEVVMF